MTNYFYLGGVMPVACLLLGCAMPASAQDSVNVKQRHDVHELKLKNVIIPTAFIGVSALSITNEWLSKQRESVQDALAARRGRKLKADDYMQYSQMTAVYGLNLVGVDGRHGLRDRTIILGMSYAIMGITVNVMKRSFKERRPDSNARNSFPSGHTATAFMGAEFLRREYQDVSPWIGYVGYAAAAATGYLRMYNDRHYINDVLAGACIGILSTKLSYWLYPKIFKYDECNDHATILALPYYSTDGCGVSICMTL